jgi:hypothetical protein
VLVTGHHKSPDLLPGFGIYLNEMGEEALRIFEIDSSGPYIVVNILKINTIHFGKNGRIINQ